MDSRGEGYEVAEHHPADEERGREEHEVADAPLLVLVHCGREEPPELPEQDRQREDDRAHQAELHDREERLRNAERDRLADVFRQRPVQPVQQSVVDRIGRDEADDEGAETDEEPLPQLFEVLDQRRLLAVLQAARKTLHGRPLDGFVLAGRGGRRLD